MFPNKAGGRYTNRSQGGLGSGAHSSLVGIILLAGKLLHLAFNKPANLL
jgi:hypothetical protein